ncbi:MAG TPA: hypothetical protein VKY19_29460 [Ktedonosporobacter sp.]|nr:hypothetical protein [Ktedonosporobacter sp.]
MGNTLQDVTNTLNGIFNDVQAFTTAVEDDFIRPLHLFPKRPSNFPPQDHLDQLDFAHDDMVVVTQQAIGQLYTPGISFQGTASDAVANLIGDYLTSESKLSAYDAKGVSTYLTQAAQLCQSTIADMQPHLNALKDFPSSNFILSAIEKQFQPGGMGAMMMESQKLEPPPGTWEQLQNLGEDILSGLELASLVGLIVGGILDDIQMDYHLGALALAIDNWQQSMKRLAMELVWQNVDSWLNGQILQMSNAFRNDATIRYLSINAGMPAPNLEDPNQPNKKDLANSIYETLNGMAPGVVTLAEIEYLTAFAPRNLTGPALQKYVEDQALVLLDLKQTYPKLPDGYLVYFVMTGISEAQIKQDLTWLTQAGKNYVSGSPFSNPAADFLAAESQRYSQLAEQQLLAWKQQIDTQNNFQGIPAYALENPQIRAFLLARKSSITGEYPSTLYTAYGYAVQRWIEHNMPSASWYPTLTTRFRYKIRFDSQFPGMKQRPDVQMVLPNGKTIIIDYTSYAEIPSKSKYNQGGVIAIIAIAHGLPPGPVAKPPRS